MNDIHQHIEARPTNWLPVPGEEDKEERRVALVDEHDLFSKGDIDSYYPKQGRGLIRGHRGESISFNVKDVLVIGDTQNIKSGARVGYDASHTSHGMKITRLKVY